MLRKRGLPATLEMDDQNIDLYDGEDLALRLAAVDPVGQVYSQVRPDSAEEQQEVFERHIRVLARAQSLWFVLPVPPSDGTADDLLRFENELKRAKAYLKGDPPQPGSA